MSLGMIDFDRARALILIRVHVANTSKAAPPPRRPCSQQRSPPERVLLGFGGHMRKATAAPEQRLNQLGAHLVSAPSPSPGHDRPDTIDRTPQQWDELQRLHVLRGALTPEEVDRLATPIVSAFESHWYDGAKHDDPEAAFPNPGVYSMGPRILSTYPEIAYQSLAHPSIVDAIEGFLGEPAVLAQYWSIMRPPGAGVSADGAFQPGTLAHYDYKPWRCVGSFVGRWVFAIIPFVDYTDEVGPLVAAPGTYRRTTLLPSDGRLHQVDAVQEPTRDLTAPLLHDPQLRRGDVLLMDGLTWHEARPNNGSTNRVGLYMKFHARSSPPACGPTIFPTAVHAALPPSVRHLVQHHDVSGTGTGFARLDDETGTSVDAVLEARLLIEDVAGRFLLLPTTAVRTGAGAEAGSSGVLPEHRWELPHCRDCSDDNATDILDACNVVGSVCRYAKATLGLTIPWLSWLEDEMLPSAAGGRVRIFAHRLGELASSTGACGYNRPCAHQIGR